MDDNKIIDLYWKRSEFAIAETDKKYGRITRNLSLNKYEYYNAKKRGQGETQVVFEELQGCITSTGNVEDAIEDMLLSEKLNCFLEGLPTEKRKIFMRRYWYLSGVKDIASDYQMSESKVKMILLRTRNALKEYLEQEGIVL